VVEAAVNSEPHQRGGAMRLVAPFAAALLIALLGAITISGHWPELQQMVRFAGKGLVASAPSDITQVEIRVGQDSVGFRRTAAGWTIDGMTEAVPAELASHIDIGLRFLHVSEPAREIAPAELTPASFAEFGLDPPASVVTVGTAQGAAATVNFGVLNPVGTSQYVRISGSPTVYLMPRHVGSEWQVAGDMARRLRAQAEPAMAHRGQSLFVPVSMAQVWAVEIVAGGKLTRFERDSAGNWFRHTGQHSHTANADAHIADPAQARIIAAALESLDATAVETRIGHAADAAELAKFGLAFPPLIVLLYARDNSTEVARIEFGGTADSLDRYARLAPTGDVVTVAEFEVKRLTDLLKAVGAGS
jgi:Domain of unknown function (DUF4340)